MSFRWFVYYCCLGGGCAAYLGWVFGRLPRLEQMVALMGLRGLFLGMALGMGLSATDAVWNLGAHRPLAVGWRALFGGLVGGIGGFLGGLFGQILYGRTQWTFFLVLGWTLTGLLIGASPGVFDLLDRLATDGDVGGATRKLFKGLLGGTVGGLLGGLLFLVLLGGGRLVLGERDESFWSPAATGFVALGLCIGLLVGLAQVILMEGWIRVEAGFRAGRELILTRSETSIGRAEGCDLGLFGDPGIEKFHARIVQKNGRYYLIDENTPGGTYLNGERITEPTLLRAGDEIGIGRARLRFGERQKRTDEEA
jgi:hypothetical protein